MDEGWVFKETHDYRTRLVARLAAQPDDYLRLASALPESEWHARRAADGATLHQLAVHVRDSEAQAFLPRLHRIRAEDNPHLVDFPSHRWSLESYRPDEPLRDVLADFQRARADGVRLLQMLRSDDWSRIGFHPPSGPRTLLWWAERIYTHARNHLWEIEHVVGQGRAPAETYLP
jgi:hypothetical protein